MTQNIKPSLYITTDGLDIIEWVDLDPYDATVSEFKLCRSCGEVYLRITVFEKFCFLCPECITEFKIAAKHRSSSQAIKQYCDTISGFDLPSYSKKLILERIKYQEYKLTEFILNGKGIVLKQNSILFSIYHFENPYRKSKRVYTSIKRGTHSFAFYFRRYYRGQSGIDIDPRLIRIEGDWERKIVFYLNDNKLTIQEISLNRKTKERTRGTITVKTKLQIPTDILKETIARLYAVGNTVVDMRKHINLLKARYRKMLKELKYES